MGLHYTVAAQTDTGTVKSVNQDSLSVKVANTPFGEAAIAVICDGMGGLKQGEVASAVVVRAYEQWFAKDFPAMLARRKGIIDAPELCDSWTKLACDCNTRLIDYSRDKSSAMGTTLTALLLCGNCFYILHIGDCRAYRMSDYGMDLITADQTYVAREVALGHMTPEQAKNDSRRNVLLQCIGTTEHIEPDFISGECQSGEGFLLCSDGFRHELKEQEMYDYCHAALADMDWRVANRQENSRVLAGQLRFLIEENKTRQEKDNISAIFLRVSDQ